MNLSCVYTILFYKEKHRYIMNKNVKYNAVVYTVSGKGGVSFFQTFNFNLLLNFNSRKRGKAQPR